MAAPFLASMAASSDRRLAVSSEIQEENKVKDEGTHVPSTPVDSPLSTQNMTRYAKLEFTLRFTEKNLDMRL